MLLMVENEIRAGICHSVYRYDRINMNTLEKLMKIDIFSLRCI